MRTEIESKSLLQRYGFITTNPSLATDAAGAKAIANCLRGPFAMKIVSVDIVHKAAAGGVRLGVTGEQAEQVYAEIIQACRASSPDATVDGVLLEEMVTGGVEVFLGARVDPHYGGVVLLGLGGSNVEQGLPPVAALTPITEERARCMIANAVEARMAQKLGPAAKEKLVQYVMAVAGPDGMLAQGAISELDINPIIVKGDQCIVVDAVAQDLADHQLALVRSRAQVHESIAERKAGLGGMNALFDPASIAFIGASTAPNKLGYRSIKNLLDFGYAGKLYPIHPKADEICGLKAYPSIEHIPGPVDRAYIAVGADAVPDMLAQCAKKGVKVVQVLTAGFTEWSGEDASRGRELEAEIQAVLAGTDMRMVGPNCIGTFSATSRMAMGAARYSPTHAKGITFISQSGTFAGDVVRRAQVQGIPVARVLSAGNCSDLDLVDYLLFCEDDPATTLTAFYAESIRDPGLFFRAAQKARKPIVLLKGGTTEQGLAAASSHTAALATNKALWDAAIKQAGILQVDSIDDLMDALLIQSAHATLAGNRLGIFGSGGGVSVTSSDAASRAGMRIPSLTPATGEALQRFGVPGTSVANPIDIPVWGLRDGNRLILADIINLLKADPNLDSLIVYIEMGSIMDFADDEADGKRQLEEICASVAQASSAGPKVSLALRSTGDQTQEDFVREQRVKLLGSGIAVFSSTARAVRAHAKLYELSSKQSRG
ncbi:MAG TPA: acetate--CoA ligase family protein [Candidimonas sp.]|nr:acetate--CoA ligase family protein [Candidimonas sp.]